MRHGSSSIDCIYDSDGIRTSKTVDGVKHTYVYASGKLLRETYGDTTIDFFYSTSGQPYALSYNGVTYYYITNVQGDVMSIVDGTGAVVASYEYDPYGNILSTAGTLAVTLGEINPLRYRGYVYDTDTGLYYLQSRYYDAKVGRFINADSYASTGQGVVGNNMFAYCLNNPVVFIDTTGTAPQHSNVYQKQTSSNGGSRYGPNIEFLMAFYGVSSPSDVPKMPDGAMIFVENITSVSVGPYITVIRGRTIVLDENKYCEYTFCGVGAGASVSLPLDQQITQGYVYGLNNATDYCGEFWGTSFSCAATASGGAFAFGGVTGEIVTGTGTGVSFGVSRTVYLTSQADWIYGRANMVVLTNPAQQSSPYPDRFGPAVA